MRTSGLAVFTLCLLLALVHPALAKKKVVDPALFPGIIGEDDRRIEDAAKGFWTAVGQVNIAGYRRRGSCSGTLIGPRLVLTAAHCVIDPVFEKTYPADHVHFSAGVHGGEFVDHAVAACVKLRPDHVYVPYGRLLPELPFQEATLRSLRGDVALIVLDHDIAGVAPLALDPAPLQAGAAVTHAGYGADRRFALSVHRDCKVQREEQGLIYTNCDTHIGASGGPLLTMHDGGAPTVAAVLSGMSAHTASLFVPVSVWPDATKEASCP